MKKRLGSIILALLLVLSVSGNAFAAAPANPKLELAATDTAGHTTLEVYLTAENVTNGRVEIRYDAVQLSLSKTAKTNDDWMVSFNSETSGVVSVAWIGSELPAGKQLILVLEFDSVNSNPTTISFSAKMTELYANSEALSTANLSASSTIFVNRENVSNITPPVVTPPTPPTPDIPVTPEGTDKPTEPEKPVEPEVTVDPDGTVTEVTKNEDGSTTTVVETTTGTTATTVTDESGKMIEAAAEIPETVENNETVTLPLELTTAATSEEAVSVNITVPTTVENIVVEIPVAEVTLTSVVVLVHEDGTEEIVSKTALTENGLAIAVDNSVTVKVVDNAKDFKDADTSWAKDAIAFVTSREIFNGTSADTFSPKSEMSRAMLMTVLARLDGADASGAEWKEKGMQWAKENGVSDGTNPDGNITREQLATMLYRYAGEPDTDGSLDSFTDSGSVSSYAEKALQWAVENGLINGMGNNILNPQGYATREQLAKIMMYFINL